MQACSCRSAAVFLVIVLAFGGRGLAEDDELEYPIALLDAYDADTSCWTGMDVDGNYPRPVDPGEWLVGPPPSSKTAVTMPQGHWLDLQFAAPIVNGPGNDIKAIEWGTSTERALVFLLLDDGREYLLDLAEAFDTHTQEPSHIEFELRDLELPLPTRAVRLVGLDWGGQSPGFDIGSLKARVGWQCSDKASVPEPIDGATDVPCETELRWRPGCDADLHIVYFARSYSQLVNNGQPVTHPPQPQSATTYDPVPLELGHTYYWRIGELDSDSGGFTLGDIWSFTVRPCLMLEDFESYWLWETPVDERWRADMWSGLSIARCGGPTSSGCPAVYRCSQAMVMNYSYLASNTTSAVYEFDSPMDWLAIGAHVLELYFRGDGRGFRDTRLYIRLDDGSNQQSIPYPGDPADLAQEVWRAFRVLLNRFDRINLRHVVSLAIEVGPNPEQAQTASGVLHVDDIRLCSRQCLEENRPSVDINGDCRVDTVELGELSQHWLDGIDRVYEIVEPNDPVLWYEFEYNTWDSAQHWNGLVRGAPIYAAGVFDGRAIRLNGRGDAVEIWRAPEFFAQFDKRITIAFWQYGADSGQLNDTVCCSDYEYGLRHPTIAIHLGLWNRPGRYNWDCGDPWSFENRLTGHHRDSAEWSGRWNHWVFTKDAEVGEDPSRGRMQIFLNGRFYASKSGTSSPISTISQFLIGDGWYGGYDGLVDEFRIYDYALSEKEAAYLATNGTGVFEQPLMTRADWNADERVDLADLVLLGPEWLEETLWP